MQSMSKTILHYSDQSDLVPTMMKTRKDNDVTDHTIVVYVENETKVSWPIELGMVCDQN